MELRAKALSVSYDAEYSGVAVIDSNVKSENFGHITVGPKFFDGGRISAEMTAQADINYVNSLSDGDYALFVLRHELAHIAPYQINMLKPYRQGLKTVPHSRAEQPWEVRATQDALDWMRARK